MRRTGIDTRIKGGGLKAGMPGGAARRTGPGKRRMRATTGAGQPATQKPAAGTARPGKPAGRGPARSVPGPAANGPGQAPGAEARRRRGPTKPGGPGWRNAWPGKPG